MVVNHTFHLIFDQTSIFKIVYGGRQDVYFLIQIYVMESIKIEPV
jgi:hypothetical protein